MTPHTSNFLALFLTIENFKVSVAFVIPGYVPMPFTKLEPRSTLCLFVGYSSSQSAYLCFDTSSNRLYTSCHVCFIETVFLFTQTAPTLPRATPVTISEWCSLSIIITSSVSTPIATPTSNALSPFTTSSGPNLQPSSLTTLDQTFIPTTTPTQPELLTFPTSTQPELPTTTTIQPHLPSLDIITRSKHNICKSIQKLNLHAKLHHPTRCKWIFHTKYHSDGSLDRYKARLVAKGFHQLLGVDLTETFSPVVKPTTVRMVVSLAISHSWAIHQLDANNTFLQGTLSEDVFMTQPPGFIDRNNPNHVCWLRKAIYGLKQALRAWYHELRSFLLSFGFINSIVDASLFVFCGHSTVIYLFVYVDDIIVTGNTSSAISQFLQNLSARQRKYIANLLSRAQMTKAKLISTPMSSLVSLTLHSGSPLADAVAYRTIIGSLHRNPVSWSSKKHKTIAWSSTEAEYRFMANITVELRWLCSFLSELGVIIPQQPVIYCENVGATHLYANPVFHSRIKHVALDYHFISEQVQSGRLRVSHISTTDQLVDALTKPLPCRQFVNIVNKIGLTSTSSILRGHDKILRPPFL
ncbi:hypothetical protein CXB51_002234 [Gossypium anomalum]|uniref:Reverse transcriptase Ty1/copia-type domain-containing protein n=1 Tax=Gossypium anomalum TaxID=47600 RepID=A0A8J6DCS3_9ROSI|nr:hypothetical protein CXB51_002234 [Gossypium anomalum]